MGAKLLTSQLHLKLELMHIETCRTSRLEIAAKTLMICNGKLWYSNIHQFCNSKCSEILPKIRSNLTALKHAQGEAPARKAPQKIRNRRP